MIWTEHVARMGKMMNAYNNFFRCNEELNHFEDISVNGGGVLLSRMSNK
jgi:hypothetical protein